MKHASMHWILERLRPACLVALVAAGVGCTTMPHRVDAGPCQLAADSSEPELDPRWETSANCGTSWAVRYPGERTANVGRHGVNYVEIDEQGILRNRTAVEDALSFAASPGAEGKPVYVVVYIHGWHHDAQAGDSNVNRFHSALASVSKWRPDRDVRGIYVGWRGESIPIPGLSLLTFWDRKSTSEEVGRGGLLEFLVRLERLVKTREQPKNRLILVGHSFGASVVFNSLAHVFLQRFLDGVESDATQPRFRGYGDLVVLINPAIEAMRYMPFQSAVRYYAERAQPPRADFSHEMVPRLVVLSSEGDWATRRAFQVARVFSTLLEAHDRVSPQQSPDAAGAYSEWEMDFQTVGNYGGFRTHERLEFAPAEASQARAESDRRRIPATTTQLKECRTLSALEVRQRIYADRIGDSVFPDSNVQLLWNRVMPRNLPYILLDVDETIISGHSDIGHPNLVCWINQLADGG